MYSITEMRNQIRESMLENSNPHHLPSFNPMSPLVNQTFDKCVAVPFIFCIIRSFLLRSQKFPNISKHFQTFPNISKLFQTYPNVSKYHGEIIYPKYFKTW